MNTCIWRYIIFYFVWLIFSRQQRIIIYCLFDSIIDKMSTCTCIYKLFSEYHLNCLFTTPGNYKFLFVRLNYWCQHYFRKIISRFLWKTFNAWNARKFEDHGDNHIYQECKPSSNLCSWKRNKLQEHKPTQLYTTRDLQRQEWGTISFRTEWRIAENTSAANSWLHITRFTNLLCVRSPINQPTAAIWNSVNKTTLYHVNQETRL